MFKVNKTQNKEEYKNTIFINSSELLDNFYCDIENNLFKIENSTLVSKNCVEIGKNFRDFLSIELNSFIPLNIFDTIVRNYSDHIKFRVNFETVKKVPINNDLIEYVRKILENIPISVNCGYFIKLDGAVMKFTCVSRIKNEFLDTNTKIKLECEENNETEKVVPFKKSMERRETRERRPTIESVSSEGIFNGDFNFNSMDIGGLDEQMKVLIRRAFGFRMTSSTYQKSLGINQVRGIILHGPPGCGKTSIARGLHKILNATGFETVNGPELLDKMVGGSEERVRKLFEPAEKNPNGYYIIFLDEFDAIGKKRGSSSGTSGDVNDKVVLQFLSKIDGEKPLNNILIIAATNRLDVIDPAFLRPGRLEVHIEVGLPNEKGRLDIINIHTKKMKENGHLAENVDLALLAKETDSYTGAEIEGIIKTATSYPIARNIDIDTFKPKTNDKPIIVMEDFMMAIRETIPAFGSKTKELITISSVKMEINSDEYGVVYESIKNELNDFYDSIEENFRCHNILLTGPYYSGKTTMVANIANELNISHIKYINAELLMNGGNIYEYFSDSKRFNNSLLIIDPIEKIIEYSLLMKTCNSKILHQIETIIDTIVGSETRIAILILSNNEDLIDNLNLRNRVNSHYKLSEKFK